jgi:AGZA family xanthine/uracil permease-like MFS transporter
VLTFFGFMHGESVGIAVTPSVAIAYAIVACFLFVLGRAPETAAASVPPLPGKTMAATPAE